jgi:hypothetical protein
MENVAEHDDVQLDTIRNDASYVYSIQVGAGAIFFGGWLNIAFYPYENIGMNNTIATFSGGFGGLAIGTGDSWGTAWFNYDVSWLSEQGWHANFEANFPPLVTQINLWGLSGENIGNTVAGGISLVEGVVGGQGWFWRG